MPRGSQPGERRGGRKRGTRNRRTLERQKIAEALAAGAVPEIASGASGLLARDVLKYWMLKFHEMAKHHKGRDPARAKSYASLAVDAARFLAPFESPTFRAVMLTPPPLPEEQVRRFTLHVFDAAPRLAWSNEGRERT